MNGLPSVPVEVSDEEMMLQLVAKGVTSDDTERSVEVFVVRKGGGMLIKIDGKPYQRYLVDLQSLCNLVVDAVVPAFLAQEAAEAAEDLKAAPMPDDRCVTRADGECIADGSCMHTPTPPVTGEASSADWVADGPQG